ncbi:G-I-Y Y-I-G endonuclease [Gordonia phage Sixama]|uniref:G-I-Y Y-I-G endonuclease n=1 Tax=Gordonia phage Sixama TaxID=2653271 RepID=A0A5Q2F1U9_9CAUD|nr:G-I-Y Y-I-G endonuclease [Gordonia phage Sixama]QGF20248.1 G-I-Y Y-I-G endonuclease [Gordonia phage Sixama]
MITAKIYGIHAGDYNFRYVGYTVRPLEDRLHQHKTTAPSTHTKMGNWLKKHPNARIEEIETVQGSVQDIWAAEIKWIAILDTQRNGMNGTGGGGGRLGQPHTDSTRELIRIAAKARGNTITPATRLKMNESLRHRVFTEEHRRKLSEKSKGRKLPVEARRKMSEAKIGKPAPNRGIPHSETTKQNMKLAAAKQYACADCGFVSGPHKMGHHLRKENHSKRLEHL